MSECVRVSNSFVDVIIIKYSDSMSDIEASKMAINLLSE